MAGKICEFAFALVMIFIGVFPFGPEVQRGALVVLGLALLVHTFVCRRCNRHQEVEIKNK